MSAAARPAGTPPGDTVQRIHWVPGSDLLLAVCHCGEQREFDDPVALWDWLLGHPHRGRKETIGS